MKDSIGRTWQCGTIQLDMLLPEKFNLTYTGEDGQKHRPVMIHRVVYGSIERFIGILIENYAGAFPAWLAPEQVRVMPITDKFNEYAKSVVDKMEALGIRAHLDDRNEKIGYKIRVVEYPSNQVEATCFSPCSLSSTGSMICSFDGWTLVRPFFFYFEVSAGIVLIHILWR